jgi:WhiB family redox-sensing transcriptional regulator
MGPEIFYPTEPGQVAQARVVCRGCSVREECLEYSLKYGHNDPGIWGGLTVTERRRLAKAIRRYNASRGGEG